jgi:hypothetical protein
MKCTKVVSHKEPWNTKGGKYHRSVDLLFDWFGLVCFEIKTQIVSSHTADSKLVKQEVNGTVILTPLVFELMLLINSSPVLVKYFWVRLSAYP